MAKHRNHKAEASQSDSCIKTDCVSLQIMNLRQENENVMDALVRTKVELAETQGIFPLQNCHFLFWCNHLAWSTDVGPAACFSRNLHHKKHPGGLQPVH